MESLILKVKIMGNTYDIQLTCPFCKKEIDFIITKKSFEREYDGNKLTLKDVHILVCPQCKMFVSLLESSIKIDSEPITKFTTKETQAYAKAFGNKKHN